MERGADPNEVWFDTKLATHDSVALRALWAKTQQCVTDLPPFDQRTGGFVASFLDGKVIKMTYLFFGPGGQRAINTWTEQIVKAHGAGRVDAGARIWTVDSLQITLALPTPFWFGAQPILIRSRRGCQAVRAAIRNIRLDTPPAPCW
jgi:hypothetical protein